LTFHFGYDINKHGEKQMKKEKPGLHSGDTVIADSSVSMMNFYRGRKPIFDFILSFRERDTEGIVQVFAFASGLSVKMIKENDSEKTFEFY
jgi:hypothetical protein